jgi:transcription elongation factor GreA
MIAELTRLESVERPKASAAIAEARDKGDLSENSEYDAAKEAQAHLEDKINRLKLAISEAKVVDVSRLSSEAVQILSKVEMTNLTTNTKMSYTIVSENEADLRAGKISIKTPIAQGLLNKKVGDEVEIQIPRGTIRLRIDKISI